jgi:chemotaxis regulatin CheY-phosphate phosphatase CheZ
VGSGPDFPAGAAVAQLPPAGGDVIGLNTFSVQHSSGNSMTADPTIKVVVNKRDLLDELHGIERVAAEYHRFLRESEANGAWESEALSLIRSHHGLLCDAGVSLRAYDLVTAILRTVLGRLRFSQVAIRAPQGEEGANRGIPQVEASESQEQSLENLERLVAETNAVAQHAPVGLQEKIRFLLLGSLNLFKGVVEGNPEQAKEAMTQINLLTSSRESQNLVREIALIARDIYDTLNALSEGIPVVDTLTESSDGISEAAGKLKAVVSKLEEAAFSNLDFLEKLTAEASEDEKLCAGVLEGLRKSQQLLGELKESHPEKADALSQIQNRLGDDVGAGAMLLQGKFQENAETYTMLTTHQSFQDLTGQTLKKTIMFIESLELQLLDVLKKYKPVFDVSNPTTPSPQEERGQEAPAPATQSQDDVDRLLAELGV